MSPYSSGVVPTEVVRQKSAASLWRSPYTRAALVCMVLIPLMRPLLRFEPPPPEPLFALPAFALPDSAGVTFGSAELAGRVYIVDFVGLGCRSSCQASIEAMAELRRRFDEAGVRELHLVSIVVDSELDALPDTLPEALHAVAQQAGPDEGSDGGWSVLTGSTEEVRALALEGFRLGEESPAGDGRGRLVLVDRYGQVRGSYGIDELGLDELFHRAQHVLKERRTKRAPPS